MPNYKALFLAYVPSVFLEKRKQIGILVCSSLVFMIWQILRDYEVRQPALSMLIPGYIVTFGITFSFLKIYHTIKEEDSPKWNDLILGKHIGLLILLGFLSSLSLIFARLSRMMIDENQVAWSLDVWLSHIPFWVSLFSRNLHKDNLVITMGTPLAFTCASVIMLPLQFFRATLLEHIFGILFVMAKSGSLVVSYHLLKTWKLEINHPTLPIQIVANVSVIVPLFLLFAAGFTETNILVEYLMASPGKLLLDALIHGSLLFCSMALLFYLQTITQPLMGAIVYCFGTNLAVLVRSSPIAIGGFLMFLFALGIHLHFLHLDQKNEERIVDYIELVSE